MKIELPWITGRRLMERWSIRLSELHQAIFFLHLPVYNSDYEREECIKYKEIPNPDFIASYDFVSEPYFIEKNNLYDFDKYCEDIHHPGLGSGYDILDSLLFNIEDVKEFEAKHGKKYDLTVHGKVTGSVIPKIKVPWMNGKRLMERWGIDLDDFTQCIFYLELPVYNSDYKKQEIFEPVEIEYPDGPIDGVPGYFHYKNTLSEFFNYSTIPDCFQLHLSAKREGEILSSFYFKIEDVEKFEVKHGMERKETSAQDIPSASRKDETTAEDFVRNLRVSYESDSKITIKIPTKKIKAFTYDELGFKDNEVWKAFVYTIKEPPHIYETGPAYIKKGRKKERISQYDTKMGRLRSINKKMINFFNDEYKAQLPATFKMYYACKEEGAGKYRFKFQVSRDDEIVEDYRSTYEQLPADQLIDEIETLGKKYSATDEQVVMEKVVAASEIAIKKGFLSHSEVNKMFNPDASEKEYTPGEVRDDDLHEE